MSVEFFLKKKKPCDDYMKKKILKKLKDHALKLIKYFFFIKLADVKFTNRNYHEKKRHDTYNKK